MLKIQCAGVILAKPDGSVLAQLRDDKPDILNPNKWGICGGGAKEGEDKNLRNTAARELWEETGYKVDPNKLRLVRKVIKLVDDRDIQSAKVEIEDYIYWAMYDGQQEIHLRGEGQEIRFITPEECLSLPVAEEHRDLLLEVSGYLVGGHPERRF